MTVRKNSTPVPELSGPMPIVYDIEGDRIYVGQPGERHADIKGKFNPGGLVEGVYDPKGNLQLRTDTDMPWTVYHLTRLWYSMYPELEIKHIYRLVGEERYKLASSNVAAKCIKALACDPLWEPAQELLQYGTVHVAGETVRDVVQRRPLAPGDFRIAVEGVDPDIVREVVTRHCGAGALVRVAMLGFETAERHLASARSNRVTVSLSTGELIDPYHEVEQMIVEASEVVALTPWLNERPKEVVTLYRGVHGVSSPEMFLEGFKEVHLSDPAGAVDASLSANKSYMKSDGFGVHWTDSWDHAVRFAMRQTDGAPLGVDNGGYDVNWGVVMESRIDQNYVIDPHEHPEEWYRASEDWQIYPYEEEQEHTVRPGAPIWVERAWLVYWVAGGAAPRKVEVPYGRQITAGGASAPNPERVASVATASDPGEGYDHEGNPWVDRLLNPPPYTDPEMFDYSGQVDADGRPITIGATMRDGRGGLLKVVGYGPEGAVFYRDRHGRAHAIDPLGLTLVQADWDTPEQVEQMVHNANILDPVQDQLSSHVYEDPMDPAPDVKPEVIDFVRKSIVDAMVDAGWPDPEEHGYLNLVLTGSLTTYQYDDDGGSDFDVSLFIDARRMPDWVRADLIRVMVGEVDGTLLPGTKIPLQAYVVPAEITREALYRQGHRSGYDLDKREWIVPPDKSLAREVRPSLKAYGQTVVDKMKLLLMYAPDAAREFWHQLHSSRQESMRSGGNDFSDANIAYKSIANAGLFPAIERLTGEHLASVKTAGSTMFHVAPAAARREIQKSGLTPMSEENRVYPGSPEGVYFWDNYEAAIQWADMHLSDSERGDAWPLLDIYEVDVSDLPIKQDPVWHQESKGGPVPTDAGPRSAWFYPGTIPPSRFRNIEQHGYHPEDGDVAGWSPWERAKYARMTTGSVYFKPIVNPDAVHHTIELREFGTDKVLGKIDLHPGPDNLNPRTMMQGMKRLWSGHWIASDLEVYDYDMSHAESDPRLALTEYAKMYYPGLEIPEGMQTSGPQTVPVGWNGSDTEEQIEDMMRGGSVGAMMRTAAWRDVQQKAVRLLRDGKVTVLVNRPNVVMGHVVGDHGEYETEITRTDPNSSMIEQWQCGCDWSQYAWGRTRKWKKLEGRPCSHVLSLYWSAKSHPLDLSEMDEGYQAPRGQRVREFTDQEAFDRGNGQIPGLSEQQADLGLDLEKLPRSFSPEDEKPLIQSVPDARQQIEQQMPAQPVGPVAPRPNNPFSPPQRSPKGPGPGQFKLFDITAPPGGQPVPPSNPTSIPGANPPGWENPGNPTQFPGTYSSYEEWTEVEDD